MIATSGGKDATLALHYLRFNPKFSHYEPIGLMTTFYTQTGRSTAHNIRQDVMQAQADALGLPLHILNLENKRGQAYTDYDQKIGRFYEELKQQGITDVMYGDIHLEDVKAYRENLNKQHGITGVYPLWDNTPQQIMDSFLSLGYQTLIVAVDSTKLTEDYLGKTMTQSLLDQLPEGVDQCAEYGEYHTFCVNGPMFKQVIPIQTGAHSFDGRNWYVDLLLSQ
ncbi:hypothetical protein [Neisseria sp. Ec49-e6-T10]|uniref:Dph6-related ATP pyrophosphatase n=1 Tax=Neisseria sp. Ec49-e6-T10 TaxID=3140744 RepID=UPI003EC14BE1